MATDENCIINYWNSMATQLFGWSASEAIGRSAYRLFSDIVDQDMRMTIFHRLIRDDCFMGVVECLTMTGQRFHADVRARRIVDALGRYGGTVITLRDVTRHRETEQMMVQSRDCAMRLVEELKRQNERKNHLLSVISHELRNPLAAVTLGQSLLKRMPQVDESARKTLDMLERQTGQLTRLVDDLLDMTRINANRICLKTEPVNLVNLILRAAADFKPLYDDKGVVLNTQVPPAPIMLQADPVRVTQVIGNLLHNALKFTDAGGQVCVMARIDKTGREARVSVQDNGAGIEPGALAHIFEPFSQTEPAPDHAHGGLGLGLSIVKGLVELHGGHVQAESDGIGKGSIFTVFLPLD